MVSETTPLLNKAGSAPDHQDVSKPHRFGITPFRLLLSACFLLSISMVAIFTPTFYLIRTFECDALYEDGILPPFEGVGDRCVQRLVEAETAKAVTLMGTLGTIAGVTNLLMASFLTRKFGVKWTILFQTVWPTFRTLASLFAVTVRGRTGVAIIQWSQLCTVLGGVAGYLLCANVYVAALVPPEERTASFGILQGTCMLGISLGYMVGGYLGDIFGDLAPFIFTTVLFILAATLTTFLPHVAPPVKPSSSDDEERGTGIFSFLAPFRVFVPRIIEPEDGGHKQRYWGMTLVGIGTFTGVLAVSYVPFLLQLTATNAYGFHAKENGVLLSLNSFCRAIFLTSIFPRIIASGRKWYTTSSLPSPSSPLTPPATEEGITSVEPIAILGEASSEPASVPSRTDVGHGSKFDLTFVTFSMLLDGTLTALTMLASSGSHLYLAAAILPFASGTAPACKGVVLALVPKHHQSDALAAVALLEMSATVATVALFGQIFAWLSELGWARYTFALNAILALISATVYTYVRFPPEERTPDSKIDVGGV